MMVTNWSVSRLNPVLNPSCPWKQSWQWINRPVDTEWREKRQQTRLATEMAVCSRACNGWAVFSNSNMGQSSILIFEYSNTFEYVESSTIGGSKWTILKQNPLINMTWNSHYINIIPPCQHVFVHISAIYQGISLTMGHCTAQTMLGHIQMICRLSFEWAKIHLPQNSFEYSNIGIIHCKLYSAVCSRPDARSIVCASSASLRGREGAREGGGWQSWHCIHASASPNWRRYFTQKYGSVL